LLEEMSMGEVDEKLVKEARRLYYREYRSLDEVAKMVGIGKKRLCREFERRGWKIRPSYLWRARTLYCRGCGKYHFPEQMIIVDGKIRCRETGCVIYIKYRRKIVGRLIREGKVKIERA
jgi:hypothetical protein